LSGSNHALLPGFVSPSRSIKPTQLVVQSTFERAGELRFPRLKNTRKSKLCPLKFFVNNDRICLDRLALLKVDASNLKLGGVDDDGVRFSNYIKIN